jgi:hypothetical protein
MPFQVPISCVGVTFGRSPGLIDSALAADAASTMPHETKTIAGLLRTDHLPVMPRRGKPNSALSKSSTMASRAVRGAARPLLHDDAVSPPIGRKASMASPMNVNASPLLA